MKNALLSLLAKEPAHGYELKQAIEEEFGALWPELNTGQVYTTLARLEKSGLVAARRVAQASRPDKVVYELTAAGRDAVERWTTSTAEPLPVRDQFFTKLILAARSRLADPVSLIETQRNAYLRRLRSLTDAHGAASTPVERLGAEGAILHAQADLKWLESLERYFLEEAP